MKLKYLLYSISAIFLVGCSSFLPQSEFLAPVNEQTKGKLYAQFFGTSTIYITDGNHSIMIDGFFTRQGYLKTFITRMKSSKEKVQYTLNQAEIEKIDALFVSHSHYDHALDSENTALITNATLMGSERTIALSPKAKSKKINVEKTLSVGDFKVSFYETPHVDKGSFLKNVEKFILWSTGGSRFKEEAEVYSFFLQHPQGNILIIPSSGFPSDINIPAKADSVFLSIGLLSNQSMAYIEDYWQRAVIETCAKRVIPIHWDNFSKPLKNPLATSPIYIDDIDKTLKIIKQLATYSKCSNSSVEIIFPPVFDSFLINRDS